MSRLLFAAARGARIDIQGKDGNWYKASAAPIENKAGVQFRIHPEDEALQYGPVSTALRHDALNFNARAMATSVEGGTWWWDAEACAWIMDCDGAEHLMFIKLILAEALADEGL
ncbi:hypothetical protein UFOVP228_38 [uncultured Caudovirales phage]|uniref:Uncharacterized protein n=1 Tax=uncultured Caudovirales phage TaxID=2100421 RepID=A0A6J7WMW1_9CAUD|nr:hypothetical protein UFOVP47_64 [uncultured Caudovirales phage]CAB5219196.1 hypothetical protein UFOVP228_38 [uncultured Caudovirales phage]